MRSGLDVQLALHIQGVKAAEDQRKETFFHPKADDDEHNIFKKKISAYELIRIHLIHSDKSGFSEDMPIIFGYTSAGVRCFGKHDVMSKRLMLFAH